MDFVTFEIAKKLKENGFDYPCISHYDINKELKVAMREPIFWHSDVLSYTDAPTISQVMKWLREEKKIYVGISYMPKIISEEGVMDDFYYPTFQKIDLFEPMFFIGGDDNYSTYEEAVLAGIEYVLDNLI